MTRRPTPEAARDQLTLRVGNWIEAHATGRGVTAVSILVIVIVAAAFAQIWLLRP